MGDADSVARSLAGGEPFDILVNSAGIARHGPALETTVEDFDAVMAVNLRGAYFVTQAVARPADRGRQARIDDHHLVADGTGRWH